MRTVPTLPFGLLDRLGPARESLSGDLIEEVHAGRSHFWLWRQVVIAIAVEAGQALRRHPVMVARGLVVGWLTLQLSYLVAGRFLIRILGDWLLDRFIVLFGSAEFPMMWATHFRLWPMMWLGNLLAGWLAVRLHRAYSGPVLLTCTLALALQCSYGAAVFWTRPRPPYYEMPYPLLSLATFALPPMIFFIGGLLAASRRRAQLSATA
jgi:hypothetical protein